MNDFRVTQKIRLVGDKKWHNYVDVEIGDHIEIQTQYKNVSSPGIVHKNVAMKAILPRNLRYVPGSGLIFTAKWPEGKPLERDTIAEGGVGIGTYSRNANAYVRFEAEVIDEALADGVTGLVSWVQVRVDRVTLQDHASIRVCKNCERPTDSETVPPEA